MNRSCNSPLAGFLVLLAVVSLGGAAARAQPCCGPITAEGERLAAFLEASGVDHLWPGLAHRLKAGRRPSRTGWPRKQDALQRLSPLSGRLGAHILRPPEHPRLLVMRDGLAHRDDGRSVGRSPMRRRRQLANTGMLVVGIRDPNP